MQIYGELLEKTSVSVHGSARVCTFYECYHSLQAAQDIPETKVSGNKKNCACLCLLKCTNECCWNVWSGMLF